VTAFGDVLASADDLAAVYGPPVDAVTNKIIDRIDGHCRDFIARAPFVLVATADAAGNCDVSPKGGSPGFVQVLDAQRLAIPDAPGNKLVYSLRNIVETARVGLLFVIPGLEETLRINGRACVTRDPGLL
jgi:PPOX class probable FMN-dependent enzyme